MKKIFALTFVCASLLACGGETSSGSSTGNPGNASADSTCNPEALCGGEFIESGVCKTGPDTCYTVRGCGRELLCHKYCEVACDVGDTLQENCTRQSEVPTCGPCPNGATCYERIVCNTYLNCVKR